MGLLAAAGPVLRVWDHGSNARAAAVALMAACVVAAIAAPCRPPAIVRSLVAAAVLVVGAGVAVPRIGRAPVLVAFASLAVAYLALVGFSSPRRTQRWLGGATLAVPLIAGAGVSWYRHGALTPVVVLLVAALLVTVLYAYWPDRMAGPDRWVERAANSLGRSIGAAITFLMMGVVVYLPGCVIRVGEAVGARRQGPRTTTWNLIEVSSEQQLRDAPYPFASTPRHHVRRRLAVGAVLLVGLPLLSWRILAPDAVGTVAGEELPIARSEQARTPDDPPIIFGREFDVLYSDLPAYRGVGWADDLQAQEAPVPDVETFRSDLVNIRDGRRVTVSPAPCDCPTATVWLTGGSAVWGIGQRDPHTIASELVRAGEAAGIALQVDNMGQRGSTFIEQVDAVEARLAEEGPPDLVVFYNGFNEAGSAMADVFLRNGDAEGSDLMEGTQQDLDMQSKMGDLKAINDQVDAFLRSGVGPEAGKLMADRQRRQMRRMDDLASRYGVQAQYVLQADALANTHQLQPYEAISNVPTDLMDRSPLALALDAAETDLGDEVTNLRHVFDDEDEQVFLGLVHHNERGAQVVAGVLLASVREALAL